ncbi:hypothetical protein [Yoonia sp. R2-816]|uniref:hypothetical protein n=1 Tax=Yoonia sp. R2-816 TaxID=3342638 RepID=UPI00372BF7C0
MGDLLSFENIYQHQGVTRHEVAFVAEIRLPDGALTADGPVIFNRITDSSVAQFGMVCGGPALFPTGLKARRWRGFGHFGLTVDHHLLFFLGGQGRDWRW